MSNAQDERSNRRFYVALIGVTVVLCWIVPMRSSLWLDETGTYWTAKDTLTTTIERAYFWAGLSPYYLIEWLAIQIGGKNEMVMRLPSVLMMGAAMFFVYRIGARLLDEESGLLAAVIFANMPDVSWAAADARPYALALMLLTGCVLALLRWLATSRFSDLAAAALLAAAAAYGHTLLAALGLVVPVLYVLWGSRQRWRVVAMGAVAIASTIPLVIQTRAYLAMDTVHVFASRATFDQFWMTLAPPQSVAAVGLGVLFAYVTIPTMRSHWKPAVPVAVALAAWIVLAPAFVFVLSRRTTMHLFVPRYLLFTAPPVALLLGSLVRSFDSRQARHAIAGVMTCACVAAFVASSRFHHGEDWRNLMATIREVASDTAMPVLIPSCFVEAQRPEHLVDPQLKDVLFAPEIFYPAAGRVIHLPYRLDDAYLRRVAQADLRQESDFLLITCGVPETRRWLEGHLGDRFSVEMLGNFRSLELHRFQALAADVATGIP